MVKFRGFGNLYRLRHCLEVFLGWFQRTGESLVRKIRIERSVRYPLVW